MDQEVIDDDLNYKASFRKMEALYKIVVDETLSNIKNNINNQFKNNMKNNKNKK